MTRVLFAALAASVACTAPPTAVSVDVPVLRCSLDVPTGTRVVLDDTGASFETTPGSRTPRSFAIHTGAPSQPGEQRRRLAADVTIAYTLHASDGGSGGAQSQLTGSLRIAGTELAVQCDDQAEPPGQADATWCLPWLATLRRDR